MNDRRLSAVTLLRVVLPIAQFSGCADGPGVGEEGSSSDAVSSGPSDTGSTTQDSGGEQAVATVVDLGAWPLCAPSAAHQEIDDQSWLFRAKYRVELLPGTYPVVPSGGIPFALEVLGESRMTNAVDDEENSFAVVPGKWREVEGGGEIDEDPTHQSVVFDAAFELDPPVVDDWLGDVGESSIHVVASMLVGEGPAEFVVDESAVVRLEGVGRMAACGRTGRQPRSRVSSSTEGWWSSRRCPGGSRRGRSVRSMGS